MVDRRRRRAIGADWQSLREAVARAPRAVTLPGAAVGLRLGAGLALYGALIWLHPLVIGVSPFP